MRRTWLGALALFVATCTLTTVHARRADASFEGTWKVTLIQGVQEVSLWLVKMDKEGKKVEVVYGLPGFDKAKLSELKAEGGAVRFTVQAPRGAFFLVGQPSKEKDTLVGTMRIGYDYFPVRFEKTQLTELDPKTAVARIGGYADLEAAF